MNREIKFRGKSLKYGNWIFGSLWIVGTKCYIIREEESEKAGEYSWYDTYVTEVLPSTVEQYAGFKDKNGKEIYEGDMLMCQNFIAVVRWNEELATFALQFSFEGKIGNTPLGEWKDMEVIGNVFSDPELIKQ